MIDYSIRRVKMSELDICTDVIRRSFETVAQEFGLTAENCPTNAAFLKTERLVSELNHGAYFYGLYCDERLIGFMGLQDKGQGAFELEKLAVLPAYRHDGGGGTLLVYAFGEAANMGANRIKIGIIEENNRLKAWYQKHGFVQTGTACFAHLPFTVGFMEKKL